MELHRIYLAASRGANLRPLLDELKRAGYQPVFLSDELDAGETPIAAARKAISRSDLLLLILTEGNSIGAAFEAGIAAAVDLPILIAATARAAVPASLRSFPVVSVKLAEPSRILDALQSLSFGAARPRNSSHEVPLGDRVERFLTSARNVTEAERIRSLAAAIEGTGALVVSTEDANDRGFDIAVWSDDLENSIGAPVLIEVKEYASGEARKRVTAALRSQPSGAVAILVYRTASNNRRPRIYDPQVLAIQEDALLLGLKERSFAEIVVMLRNSAAHASSEY